MFALHWHDFKVNRNTDVHNADERVAKTCFALSPCLRCIESMIAVLCLLCAERDLI